MEGGRGEMVSLALGAGEVVSLTPAGGQVSTESNTDILINFLVQSRWLESVQMRQGRW